MKKLLLSSFAVTLLASTVSASTLSPEQALNRISNSSGPMKARSLSSAQLKMTRYADEKPVIYLFSLGEDKGFIAVSANDNSVPLLGYSETGTFSGEEALLPDGLKYWLSSLGEQIALNQGTYKAQKSGSIRASISPLVETRWNQDEPYNNECPSVSGRKCYTGCVATAMAQALKYYNYPSKGTGTHSYTWNNQTLSFNYGSNTFDWANMSNTYGSSSTTAQKNAVANLMYACGVGVDMDYGTSSSGAVSFEILRAFIENFGYDKGLEYRMRDYYTISDWEDLVYNNLVNYGPVLYGGQSNDGGHEFICDGYNNGYFHFNWGWGGMSDGYFILTALDPESQGIGGSTSGYNFDQDIVIKMQTENTSQYAFEQMTSNGDFTINQTTATLGQSVSITGSYINYSYATITPTIGVEIIPQDGSASQFVTSFNAASLDSFYGYMNANTNFTLPANLAPGTYTIRPAFKCTNALNEVIPVLTPINNRGSYTMTVSGNQATFSAIEPADITASGLKFETDLYLNTDFKATANIDNTSSTQEYYGEVAIIAFNSSGSAVAMGDPMQIDVLPGESLNWQYVSTLSKISGATVTSGAEYNFYICKIKQTYNSSTQSYSYSYTPIGNAVSAKINAATNATLTINDLKIEFVQEREVEATATVTCTSGYFAGSLPLYIFPYTSGQVTSLASYSSDFFAVSANSSTVPRTAKITYNFNFNDAEENTSYFGEINYNGNWISNQAVFKSGEFTGIENMSEISDVTETEYYTLSGIRLNRKPEQQGIYIVRERHSDGSVTSTRRAY